MSVSQVLQRLCTLEKSSPEFLRGLYTFLRLDEKGEHSLNLQQSESTRLVNFLDGALDAIPVTDDLFRRCLRRLRLICGRHNILPESHIISDGLKRTSDNPVACGGFADVWEGTLRDEKVCVKVLRMYRTNTNNPNGSLAAFYGEAVVWKRLRHPNVVPFLGVTTTPLQLVSKWMPNGTLTEYVNTNPGVDRISLLLDVAEGINYLHTCHMLHGDLKGPNILIDGQGHARVSDFGLASVVHGNYSTGVKSEKGHTVRWSAPEVLSGAVPASKQADIFAFGMVVVEVFTGAAPFHDITSTMVTLKAMKGERPPRPQGAERLGLSDALWRMTEYCWQHPPKERLKSSEVVDLLREMYMESPSNTCISAIGGAGGLVGSGLTIPQTDAALSPRLLEILQYREPAHKRTPSGLKDDRIVVNDSPKRSVSTIGNQTTGQHTADGIMQRLNAVGQDQNSPPIRSPARSETPDIDGTGAFWSIPPTTPNPGGSTLDSPEPPATIPQISIQAANSVPSDASSFTVVDSFESPHPAPAGSTRTHRGARDARNNRGADDRSRDNRETSDSDSNHGDSNVKNVGDVNSRRTEPRRPGPPEQRPRTHNRDLAALTLQPIEQTPSRNSSARRKGFGGLLATALGRGGGGSRTPTRATTPTAEQGDSSKGQERGRDLRASDSPPQQTGAAKKGLSGWERLRVMKQVIGLHKRHHPQPNDTRE